MANLRIEENILFDRWRTSMPEAVQRTFVTDGAVAPEAYEESSVKVLLLLKEVNDPDGGGWCLREYLQNGGRSQTWNIVTRWLIAIRALPMEVNWSELEAVTEAQRCKQLQSIAAMNFKKVPGHYTTDLAAWWPIIQRDKLYIRQQFDLYKADIVVCCGSSVTSAFNAHVKPAGLEWRRTSRGVDYLEYMKHKYVLAYSHPEARVAPNLIHYGLVDALREVLFGFVCTTPTNGACDARHFSTDIGSAPGRSTSPHKRT